MSLVGEGEPLHLAVYTLVGHFAVLARCPEVLCSGASRTLTHCDVLPYTEYFGLLDADGKYNMSFGINFFWKI